MAPDYVLVPQEESDEFVRLAERAIRSMYPTIRDNPDYTATASERSFRRLRSFVEEVQQAGSRVIQFEPELMDTLAPPYRFPPTLVVDPPDDSALMREEIFGPVLPIKSYGTIDDAVAFVNRGERPLALYYFGRESSEKDYVLAQTWAGGVTVNDVMMHPMMTDLPFGGVGSSGMGRYIGREGFLTFSNVKSVYEQGWLDLSRMSRPPYGKAIERMLAGAIKK
jgi:coniferyl-aldehyde dehydrogenase